MGERARFSLVAEQSDVADCDTLIYYWPKNKPEAQFQLMNLLSCCRSAAIFSWSVKTAAACAALNRCWKNTRR
jgi:16S rRNA G1207 methylase RsmC